MLNMDYSAIEDHIALPQQSRSRATMERVLEATERLLESKPFEDLTIMEIAGLAKAPPPSIYARFGDKEGLLLAVHERFKQSAEKRLADTFGGATTSGWSAEEIVEKFVSDLFRRYQMNHFLLRSVLLSRHETVMLRTRELLSFVSGLQADALLPLLAGEPRPERFEANIDFMVRSVAALAQQWLIFAPIRISRFEFPDEELVRRVTALALACLYADGGSSGDSAAAG